jgi:hypothetical protein
MRVLWVKRTVCDVINTSFALSGFDKVVKLLSAAPDGVLCTGNTYHAHVIVALS